MNVEFNYQQHIKVREYTTIPPRDIEYQSWAHNYVRLSRIKFERLFKIRDKLLLQQSLNLNSWEIRLYLHPIINEIRYRKSLIPKYNTNKNILHVIK